MSQVISISKEDIPDYLHDSCFYKNLDMEDHLVIESKFFLNDLNINGSDSLLLLINTINYWDPLDEKLYFLLFDFCHENDLKDFINELYKTSDIPLVRYLLYMYDLENIEKDFPFYPEKLKDWIFKKYIKNEYEKLKLLVCLIKHNFLIKGELTKYYRELNGSLFIYLLTLGKSKIILEFDNEQILSTLKKLLTKNYPRENTIILCMISKLNNLELLQMVYQVSITSKIIFEFNLFDALKKYLEYEKFIEIKNYLLEKFDNTNFLVTNSMKENNPCPCPKNSIKINEFIGTIVISIDIYPDDFFIIKYAIFYT